MSAERPARHRDADATGEVDAEIHDLLYGDAESPSEAASVGRPTRYRAEYAEQAHKLCLLGATDAEMADFFGVVEKTLNTWKQRHKEFLQSITRGKDQADADVAEKLRDRAMGYSHPEEKIFQNNGEVIRVETVKHYPPDTQAASLWLRNRQPAKWRDKQQHEHTGADGGPLVIELVRFGDGGQ